MKVEKIIAALLLLALPYFSIAQEKGDPPINWQNLDLNNDNTFGISTEKSYLNLLRDKKSVPVIVAVLDGGVDINHPDLKDIIWVNTKEIPNNGIDDDNNGYVDDVNGWNFIGSSKGNVEFDNLEVARLYRELLPKFGSALVSTPFTPEERKKFIFFNKVRTDYMDKLEQSKAGLLNVTLIRKTVDEIVSKMGVADPTFADFDNYKPANDTESRVIKALKPEFKKTPDYKKVRENLEDAYDYYNTMVNYNLNLEFDPRPIVGDDYENSSERFYGNNDVKGPDAEHGTHVAGIIGAIRNNAIGVKGVANNVRIMAVRTVPNGDERDKDVANAIRYAVDNGAKVINMSFGKGYSKDKTVVDSAVRYAVSKDVLLVHAAGNDSKNTNIESNYPNRNYADTTGLTIGTAPLWIEVGASSWVNNDDLAANFSNFGSKGVDVFAPGVKINSTVPDNKYKVQNGTSMASPVVAGLAALIRSYYPKLTAIQVKDIIITSVTKVDHKVKIKENGSSKRVNFEDICVSGGIVNVYQALLLAAKQSL